MDGWLSLDIRSHMRYAENNKQRTTRRFAAMATKGGSIHMKANLYAFADEASQTLQGQIAAMKRNGLQGLELRMVDGKNGADITVAEAKEIRKQLEDHGLCVWSLGSPIGKVKLLEDDMAAHTARFQHALEVSAVLGAGNMRMFSFYLPEGDPAVYRSQVIDELNKMAELAKGSGVTLCHENEKGIYGDNAARCLDVLQNVPGLCGVFDPANFVQCGQDTLEAWKLLKPYTKYMHIKDALADGRVVPAGDGEGHVAQIVLDYLKAGGSALTLEPHLFEFVGLASLEKEGARSQVGQYAFGTPDDAFDAACNAIKRILA